MEKKLRVVDISDSPDLLRLAREAHETNRPQVLRTGGKDIARIVPMKPARRKRAKTEEEMAAFRSSFGGWKDVDTDKLIADIYESRRISTRQ